MKRIALVPRAALICVAACLTSTLLPAQMVYETETELITTGDFDGNGKLDIAIVDKASGRMRIGYRATGDAFQWPLWRPSGVRYASGLSVGRITDLKFDSLAVTAANESATTVVDLPNNYFPISPLKVPIANLGPSVVVAVNLGGADASPFLGLYVASIYNPDPTPYRVTLLRNDGRKFTQTADFPTDGEIAHANRLALRTGGPELVTMIVHGEKADSFRAERLDGGKPEAVLTIDHLPKDTDYVLGSFRSDSAGLKDLVFYTSGRDEFRAVTLEEAGGKFHASSLRTLSFGRPVRSLVTVNDGTKSRLLAIFGGQEAELLDFDAVNAPVSVQKLAAFPNRSLNAAVALPDALVLFSALTNNLPCPAAFYTAYFLKDGNWVSDTEERLLSPEDHDLWTVPDIRKSIVANLTEKSAADMKAYTNVIPGSQVSYEMVPIPGGEFVMGSPDSEPRRQNDEGPQHRVRISPFWMGRYEVTWEEYLLFQYPYDELRLREKFPTPEAVNALSDAVTHPTKPYPDMSFGMGKKKGMPVISMTQHAANKYCQWLSAKTGHFYRLPTEAEWEYACRAGTTTTWYFGDDPSKLKEHAWFFDNSDSKYHKVGMKLPNPWGLYDMYGNVSEWVLDQFDPDYYPTFSARRAAVDPWNRATKPYPHVVRGGSWEDEVPALRSAARSHSDRAWKSSWSKSAWHLTDAPNVGFRLVRPLAVPSAEDLANYWNSGVERD